MTNKTVVLAAALLLGATSVTLAQGTTTSGAAGNQSTYTSGAAGDKSGAKSPAGKSGSKSLTGDQSTYTSGAGEENTR
jgi:hypothetical protein